MKDDLRQLHRGLEKGIKRQMTPEDVLVLFAVWEGQAKGWSLHRIQRSLERKNVIPRRSREGFRKRVTKLLSIKSGQGPFYNSMALPKPEDIPEYIREAWDKAKANLRELLDEPKDREELEDYIRERRQLFRSHFPKTKK